MKWLDRELVIGPHLCLCTTEAEFQRAMARLKVPPNDRPQWVSDNADATTHLLQNNGRSCAIVAVRVREDITPIQVAAMLVHEAVHVWQEFRDTIGERNPSSEFEAYSIQSISQRLMQAYADSLSH